jgi:hypothetical protein
MTFDGTVVRSDYGARGTTRRTLLGEVAPSGSARTFLEAVRRAEARSDVHRTESRLRTDAK